MASSTNLSGSSCFLIWSINSFGKRMRSTRVFSSVRQNFLNNGLRTSHVFLFCFLTLQTKSSHNSLSPRMLIMSFTNAVIQGLVFKYYCFTVLICQEPLKCVRRFPVEKYLIPLICVRSNCFLPPLGADNLTYFI